MVDQRLHAVGEHGDLGMHPVDQQVGLGYRHVDVGLQELFGRFRQPDADFAHRLLRQTLHVPDRHAPGEHEVEEHRGTDDEDELGAETAPPHVADRPPHAAERQWTAAFGRGAHEGFRPDVAQMGQPA